MTRADKPKDQDLPTNDEVRDKAKRARRDPAGDADAASAPPEIARLLLPPGGPSKPDGARQSKTAPTVRARRRMRRTRALPRPASPKGRVGY